MTGRQKYEGVPELPLHYRSPPRKCRTGGTVGRVLTSWALSLSVVVPSVVSDKPHPLVRPVTTTTRVTVSPTVVCTLTGRSRHHRPDSGT